MNLVINRMDLKRTYIKYKEEYQEAIQKVCEDTAFSGGKYAENFEKEYAKYCNVKAAAGVNSGTSALFCAMKALGIKDGDEVIVPANTFIASAWAPSYVGATPVFVDCTADTWEIQAEKVEQAITKQTKAIIGVHLYGQPFEFEKIKDIADKYNLYIVEDCAQAHGALYKDKIVGSLGNIGCFSFYPGKNLFCFGEGGAVTSNNIEYINKVNKIKNHGCDKRYYHDEIGYNMRMEGIQGAVLSVSLKYIDEWNAIRRRIAHRYKNEIKNPLITMQSCPEYITPVYHLFVITIENREKFLKYMESKNIRCDLHYPVPCHLQKAYSDLGYKKGSCPNAEYLADHCVSLPMYPELLKEEIDRVINACNNYQ